MDLDPSQAFRHRVRMRGQPAANPAAVVVRGQARFTVLADRLIRLEWSRTASFEDRATFAFPTRYVEVVPSFTIHETENELTLTTKALTLTYRPSADTPFQATNLSISLAVEGREGAWQPGLVDPDNLGGTVRTLDNERGRIPLGPGLISRAGWALVDDSHQVCFSPTDGWAEPRPDLDGQDWYFFGYGHDYVAAIGTYSRVFGAFPHLEDQRLPPRYALGAWWSRYWAYRDQDLRELVGDFATYALPLDVLVIDMDWHTPNTWTGYTWNRELFPDPPGFLAWLHEQGLRVTLNLHPADGVQSLEERYPLFAQAMGLDHQNGHPIPFRPGDRQFMRHYFEILHHPLEDEGVDFWWMDWQQGQESDIQGLDPLPWLNHLHFMDATRRGQRPMLFSRYGGLGSHRYYFGFSGDTSANWESLRFQPYFTATAANVGYGWWSHDIGSHYGAVEPELFLRWVQFGALSPALRLHATKDPLAERRPWAFSPPILHAVQAAFQLRYQLIPYLYSAAWQAQQTGLSLCLPMYYHHPEDNEAYQAYDQYYLGADLIAAPITTPAHPATATATQRVWLPAGTWFDWQTAAPHTGPGWVTVSGGLERIPLFARAGAAIPLAPPVLRSQDIPADHLTLRIFPPGVYESSTSQIYDDDGLSLGYLRGEYELTTATTTRDGAALHLVLEAGPEQCPTLPPQRRYTLLVGPVALPDAVTINDEAGAAWSYDATTLMATVQVPDRPRQDRVAVALLLKG